MVEDGAANKFKDHLMVSNPQHQHKCIAGLLGISELEMEEEDKIWSLNKRCPTLKLFSDAIANKN